MTNELHPCWWPSCLSENTRVSCNGQTAWWGWCNQCGARSPVTLTREETVTLWNAGPRRDDE